MEYEWVIGRYEGKQADWVEDNAHNGIGYFIQRTEGKGKARIVVAAFKRACDGPRPQHLDLATASQVEKLELLAAKREGRKVGA